MQQTRFEDWERWRREGCTRLPIVVVCENATLPASWEGFADTPASVLLESGRSGRTTYLCDRPARVIIGYEAGAEIRAADATTRLGWRAGKPLDVLAALLAEQKTPALHGGAAMAGGVMGALGYDIVHTWESLPRRAVRDLPLPLYAMVETRELFVFDHAERTLTVVGWTNVEAEADPRALAVQFQHAQQQVARAHERWRAGGGRAEKTDEPRGGEPPADTFSPHEFQAAVRRVQDYVAAGHTYQVNLSLRTSRPAPASAEAIYESLRRVNPSPYMGLLRLPEFALVCGSPELLVRLADGVMVSRPIAGTRPRGFEAPHDAQMSAELLANEKERAEHLMLVDLIRNDLGRVAAFGSVHVPEFLAIERYSHVMHLVSEVTGHLADGRTWRDLLQAIAPGGTITGCPKIRTMEIIEEIEPVGRGFYTGSLGWISYGGDLEMNIIIRTLLLLDGVAYVQAGAGIVADSQPEREFDEASRKAAALWVALENALTESATAAKAET